MPGRLALTLLVLCVLANHPNDTAAGDDLALDANLLYRCTDLHDCCPSPRTRTAARGIKNLFVAVNDPPAIQVVGAQLHSHTVARQNANEILAHPSRDMGQHLVVIFELDLKHGVGQRFKYRRHYLNHVFFGQTVSRFCQHAPARPAC